MAIQAVIFDFGGVIVPGSPVADGAPPYADVEQRFGLEPQTIWRAMYLENERWLGLRVGEGTHDLWHASIHEAVRKLTDDETAHNILVALGEKRPVEFNPGMIELVSKLREDLGLPVGLLSNAAPGLEDDLRDHYAIYDLFDDVINSATVRLAKPDPAIYRLAAERLAVPVEACFFTDDLPHNIESARKTGMMAHQFEGCEGLKTALRDAGVAV